ncbi:MAG: CYTH domain-containing protein [Pseudomarimonas sp.]
MAIEIERKFLLVNASWRAQVLRSHRLAQGYLGGERASVRVRIGGDSAWLTIKARVKGASRTEFEYGIPLPDAEQILAELSLPGRVEKIRHHVEVGGMLWEIDEFLGDNAGLIVAEIELPSVETHFERADWLGAEITDQQRYYNSALAERPFSAWTAAERMPSTEQLVC